jgi:hypothetical protein
MAYDAPGRSGGMADAADLKSAEGNLMRVRISPSALHLVETGAGVGKGVVATVLDGGARQARAPRPHPRLREPWRRVGSAVQRSGRRRRRLLDPLDWAT